MSTYTDTVLVRVYLEGVLFPYVKSIVVSQTESNVTCQMEVPPSIALTPDKWAGMTCHIFFANKRVLSKWGDTPPELLNWIDADTPPDNKGWPILFQGELAGETQNATVQSENIILNFVGHSRHYEQTIQFFTDPKNWTFDTQQQAYVVGNANIQIDYDGALSKSSQLLYTLHQRIADFDDSSADIAILSTVIDILKRAEENHAIFGHFNNKLQLDARFGVYPDPDVKRVLSLKQMAALIDKRAQALPSYTSLMKILGVATDILHYNWNHIAQPQLRTTSENAVRNATGFVGPVQGNQANSDQATKVERSFDQFVAQFRGKTKTMNLEVGTVAVPLDFRETSKALPKKIFVNRVLREFENASSLNVAFQRVIEAGFRPEGIPLGKRRPPEDEVPQALDLNDLNELITSAFASEDGDTSEQKDVLELTALDQARLSKKDILTEFIITPRLHYAQPPRCNVIMPYSFNTYGITRDHFREPTRLYGRVPLMPSTNNGQEAIVWYVAPASQAYHYLNGSQLAKFDPQYAEFMSKNMGRYEVETESTNAGTSADFN